MPFFTTTRADAFPRNTMCHANITQLILKTSNRVTVINIIQQGQGSQAGNVTQLTRMQLVSGNFLKLIRKISNQITVIKNNSSRFFGKEMYLWQMVPENSWELLPLLARNFVTFLTFSTVLVIFQALIQALDASCGSTCKLHATTTCREPGFLSPRDITEKSRAAAPSRPTACRLLLVPCKRSRGCTMQTCVHFGRLILFCLPALEAYEDQSPTYTIVLKTWINNLSPLAYPTKYTTKRRPWQVLTVMAVWAVVAVSVVTATPLKVNPPFPTSWISPPHHPEKRDDSQIARGPVHEPHLAPNLLWIWPPSLAKTDKSTIEGWGSF